MSPHPILFLHGLDSSSHGTKARWFRNHFPETRIRDYTGDLEQRLTQLEEETVGLDRLILVGSSFGGLMAACFAVRHPHQCQRLILLAPSLNFSGYQPPIVPLTVPTILVIGAHDTFCSPEQVLPLARATFASLTVRVEDDDHMLHRTFPTLDWRTFLV